MIHLPAVIACAALALVLARRRPAMRPAAVALAALACIDGARFLPLPARVDVLLWVGWPSVFAVLAWKVWVGSERADNGEEHRESGRRRGLVGDGSVRGSGCSGIGGVCVQGGPHSGSQHLSDGGPCDAQVTRTDGARSRNHLVPFRKFLPRAHHAPILARLRAVPAWARVAASFALYAGAIAFAPIPWRSCPLAWTVARTLPYVVAPCLGMVAWATRPRPRTVRPSPTTPFRVPPQQTETPPDPAAQAPRRVAALLTVSACLDITVGALAPGASYSVAAPLAWTTWAACAVALLLGARRTP